MSHGIGLIRLSQCVSLPNGTDEFLIAGQYDARFGGQRHEQFIQDLNMLDREKVAMNAKKLAVLPALLFVAMMFMPAIPAMASRPATGQYYYLYVYCESESGSHQSDTQILVLLGHAVSVSCGPGNYRDNYLSFSNSGTGTYYAISLAGGKLQTVTGSFGPTSCEAAGVQYGPYGYSWTEWELYSGECDG